MKARGCHLEFWFWLGIARIQDLSITSPCVFGSGASDWEYVAGGVDSETLHRDSSRCFGGLKILRKMAEYFKPALRWLIYPNPVKLLNRNTLVVLAEKAATPAAAPINRVT